MRGSLYPDGVIVDTTALVRTETSKAGEIKRNRIDFTSRGMFTGGEITVNLSDTTRIDIKQLSGYAPNGEFIQTTSDYYSIVLNDYTINAMNYVCAVYSENNVGKQPHESDGLTYATEAQAAWRIRVYEETVFLALPFSDSNLANDARDRCLIIGKVKANGPSVALTSSSIFSPTVFNNILYSTPAILSTISGVTVIFVSYETPTGDGILLFDDTSLPTYGLQWQSSTGGPGSLVNFTVDGTYDILDGLGNYIRVQVAISQLPIVGGTLLETISISNLYYQEIVRLTGEDTLHRNLIGSGIVTTHNPHGLSIADLEGIDVATALGEHQDVQHCNGIWKGSSSSIFGMSLIINVPSGGDTLVVQPPSSGDLYYINGKKLISMSPSNILFTPANFLSGALGVTVKEGSKLYEVYVDDNEVMKVSLRADTNPVVATPRNVTGAWIIDMSDDHLAGNYDLKCVVSAGPVYTFTWGLNGGTKGLPVVVDNTTLPGAGDPEGQVIRLYDSTGVNWIDLYLNRTVYGPGPDARLQIGIATYTDIIKVSDHLDYSQNMKIGSVLYWWDISRGTLGWETDFAGGGGSRHTMDHRPWGNMCSVAMADEALQYTEYNSADELHYSGILFARDEMNGGFHTDADLTGLDFPVRGGHCYFRGKRLTSLGNIGLTIYDDTTSIVYVDEDGTVYALDVGATTIFGGDLVKAMTWLLGSSYDRPFSSDTPYFGNDLDYAEKGVPLYVVTASGGNITRYYDVSRNVNGPVDPWSVGIRRNYSFISPDPAEKYLAAFDSLEAAFLHVNVLNMMKNKVQGITITLVGESYIFAGAPVTQPSEVNVVGSGISTTDIYAVVRIKDLTPTGSWVLEGGNSVSRVKIYPTISVGVTDGSVFGLNSYCTVEDVHGLVATLALGTSVSHTFFCLDTGADLVSVKIRNCNITTSGVIFRGAAIASSRFVNLEVSGNRFYGGSQRPSARGLVYLSAIDGVYNSIISGNYIESNTKDTHILIAHGIYLHDPTNCRINKNTVFVQEDTIRGNSGITIDGGKKCYIMENSVIGYSVIVDPNPTTVLQGNKIFGIKSGDNNGCPETMIKDNIIINVGYGIYVGGAVNGVSIEGNLVNMFYTDGIKVAVYACDDDRPNTISSISINDNIIRNGYYTGGAFFAMYGIYFIVDYNSFSPGEVHLVENINIKNNNIDILDSNATTPGYIRGISFWVSGGVSDAPIIRGISISNNTIGSLEGDSDTYGIHIKVTVDQEMITINPLSAECICVDGNKISCSDAVTALVWGVYFDVGVTPTGGFIADVGFCSISNNIISVASTTTNTTDGIYVGTLHSSKISGNMIYAGRYGIDSHLHINGSITNNKITTNFTGILFNNIFGHEHILADGNKIVAIRKSTYSTMLFGIDLGYAVAGGNYITVSNNDIFLDGSEVFGTGGLDQSQCLRGCANLGNFIIKGNNIKADGDISNGSYAYGLTIGENWFGNFTIENNTIDMSGVSAVGTGQPNGLFIAHTHETDSRGILNGNTVTTQAFDHTLGSAGPPYSLYIGASGIGSIVTFQNNAFLCTTYPGVDMGVNLYFSAPPCVFYLIAPTNFKDMYSGGGIYALTAF